MHEPGHRIYDEDGNLVSSDDPRLKVAQVKLTREQEAHLALPEVQEEEKAWREWYENGAKGPSPGQKAKEEKSNN